MDTKNLQVVLDSATAQDWQEGRAWYSDALQTCKELSCLTERAGQRIDVRTIVEVMALLSVGCDWDRNIQLTVAMVESHVATGRADCRHMYGRQIEQARRILAGAAWADVSGHGPKVDAFRAAILGDWSQVVVDRHAFAAIKGRVCSEAERKCLSKPKCYEECAKLYRDLAAEVDEPAAVVQAVVWVAWRRENSRHRGGVK